MPDLSLCLAYYMNPGMLGIHYRHWAAWPEALKARVEIVIVDDASPTGPAIDVPRPAGMPQLSIYRVTVDQPWHQHGARNLAADRAVGKWLLLTDMDHALNEVVATRLFDKIDRGRITEDSIYTLHRREARTGRTTRGKWWLPNPHPNSFVLTRNTYWHIGGYDEDLCGVYGTDSAFRWRAFARARRGHLSDIALYRYGRGSVPDASTTTLARKSGRNKVELDARIAEKKALGPDHNVPVLTFEWSRQL